MTFMNKAECSTDPYLKTGGYLPGFGCISWSAVLTGALVGVGLSFLLNLFTIAIGVTAFISKDGATSLAIGGYIATLIGVIAIMFFAGFVSGYLARKCCAYKEIGALYGFLTWTVSLIIVILLASGFTHFVASYYHTLFGPDHNAKQAGRISNYPALTTESQTASTAQGAPSNRVNESVNNMRENAPGDTNKEKAENVLLTSLITTFFLFFIGAVASAFGGYFGLACGCDERYGKNDVTTKKVGPKDTL